MKNLGYMLLVALLLCCTCVQCSEKEHQTPPALSEGDDPGGDGGEENPEGLPGYPKGLTVDEFTQELANGSKCLGLLRHRRFQGESEPAVPSAVLRSEEADGYFSAFAESGDGTPYLAVNGVSSAVRLRLACSSTGVWSDRSPCRRIGYGPQILTRISSPCGPLWGSCATEVSRRPGSIAWPTTTTVPMLSRPRSATTRRP